MLNPAADKNAPLHSFKADSRSDWAIRFIPLYRYMIYWEISRSFMQGKVKHAIKRVVSILACSHFLNYKFNCAKRTFITVFTDLTDIHGAYPVSYRLY